jgi:hypothetical protein
VTIWVLQRSLDVIPERVRHTGNGHGRFKIVPGPAVAVPAA